MFKTALSKIRVSANEAQNLPFNKKLLSKEFSPFYSEYNFLYFVFKNNFKYSSQAEKTLKKIDNIVEYHVIYSEKDIEKYCDTLFYIKNYDLAKDKY